MPRARRGTSISTAVEAAITPRTRAIAVVHFLGYPVRMDKVKDIAGRHGLFVMEDAALAVGTYYKGEHAGTMGDAGCFSFYPVKHMTTAEGGMILARDKAFADRLQRLKAFGLDRTLDQRKQPGIYDVTDLGFNFRMNEIEAALGIEQLKRMPDVLARRHENYDLLAAELAGMDEVTVFPERAGNKDPDCVNSCYCLSAVLDEKLTGKRPDIVNNLKAKGVGSSVYYPMPVPMLTYYREKYGAKAGQFPIAQWISDGAISLPVGAHLDIDDMRYVASAFKQAVLEFDIVMLSFKDHRVLLVGGAGFIGHNLAIKLKELGAEVAIIDGLQVNNLSSFLSTTAPDPNRALYVAFVHERLRLLAEFGDHGAGPGRARLSRHVARRRPIPARHRRASRGRRSREPRQQGSVFDIRPLDPHSRECARCFALAEAAFRLLLLVDGLRQLPGRRRYRGHGLQPARHLRRTQVRWREAGHRVQPGLRPALHDRPPVGTLRRALRKPPRDPGVH